MHYKLTDIQQFQVQTMNTAWLERYKEANPNDKITTAYANSKKIGEFYYIIKDAVTSQYIIDYTDIVSILPDNHTWHNENKTIQIILTEKQAIELVLLKPDYALLNKQTVHENGCVYIYVNEIISEDREQLKKINAIINEK